MAGLSFNRRVRSVRIAVALATVGALGGGCQPVLGLKAFVEREVEYSKIGLTLYDGGVKVLPGGTVRWSNTIFGEPSTKILTLKNDGASNVTLSGPLVVSKTGGGGAAAYGGIVQPVQVTLPPGGSTTFSADFTPPSPDGDYACDFVVNSNDASFPAYTFTGSGHSTQWHGSKDIVSSVNSSLSYSQPKLAYRASPTPTLFIAYKVYDSVTPANSGIALRSSTDGGKSWSAPTLAVASTDIGGFSFATTSTTLHLFYSLGSASTCHYMTSYPNSLSFTAVGTFAYGTQAYNSNNSAIVCANGQIYVVAYDNTNSPKKLHLYARYDTFGAYSEPAAFSQYTIVDGVARTGGFYPSLKVDGNNAYVSYLDSRVLRAAVIPLSSIATPASWSYRAIYTDPSYNLAYNALAIDSSRAYILYSLSDGGVAPRSISSTNLSLASWSSPNVFPGESSSGTPNIQLVESGGAMYSAWTSYTGGVYTLRMASSSDGGVSWATKEMDSADGLGGVATSVAAAGSSLFFAYSTGSGHPNKYSITLMKSLDGGATW